MFFRIAKPKFRIEVRNGGAGWYWRLVSSVNGKTTAHSEVYSDLTACMDTAESVASNAGWPVAVMGL